MKKGRILAKKLFKNEAAHKFWQINSYFLNEDYVIHESQIGMCVLVILYLPSEARPALV